jgi:hypothetical protein
MANPVNRDCGAIALCDCDEFKVVCAAQVCDPKTRFGGVNANGSFGERDHLATALSVRRHKTVQFRANGGADACISNTKNISQAISGRIRGFANGRDLALQLRELGVLNRAGRTRRLPKAPIHAAFRPDHAGLARDKWVRTAIRPFLLINCAFKVHQLQQKVHQS